MTDDRDIDFDTPKRIWLKLSVLLKFFVIQKALFLYLCIITRILLNRKLLEGTAFFNTATTYRASWHS